MNLDIDVIAKLFGTGVALAAVVAAAFYTATKVIRSDNTLNRLVDSVEEERDYWKSVVLNERAAAVAAEQRLAEKLDRQAALAALDRERLQTEIEGLRRALHLFMLKG